MSEKIIDKLKRTLNGTGYVREVEVFEGKFNEKINESPYVSYVVNFENKRRDTKLHELERRIRGGFYNGHYLGCTVRTCIEEISLNEERHKIFFDFSNEPNEKRQSKLLSATRHLIKIIEEEHYKGRI